MIAFHGDPKIKDKYLARVRAHQAADELIKGQYWEDGKGCAVGCTIHSGNHAAYETELGIPAAIAYLEDRIFESLPNGHAREWPAQFLESIPVGADLSMVVPHFLHWLLSDEHNGVIRFAPPDDRWGVKSAIEGVAALFADWVRTGGCPPWEAARAADAAARAAARAAADTAWAAAWAADAARAAAKAVDAARAADVARAADAAVWGDARIRQSEKLLELLAAAPVRRS